MIKGLVNILIKMIKGQVNILINMIKGQVNILIKMIKRLVNIFINLIKGLEKYSSTKVEWQIPPPVFSSGICRNIPAWKICPKWQIWKI